MDTFVNFKKSSWQRRFEKGELTHEEAIDEWRKARDVFYQSQIHAAHVDMLENSSVQPVTVFRRGYREYGLNLADGRVYSRVKSEGPSEVEMRTRGISIRTVLKPDPNERVLYYVGRNIHTNEPMFGGVFDDTPYNEFVRLRGERAYWDAGYTVYYSVDNEPFTYQAWGGVYEDPLAGRKQPIVNVGTIGHCDHQGRYPSAEFLSPLQQAIRDINHGKVQPPVWNIRFTNYPRGW